MLSIGFLFGVAIAAPVFFALGAFTRRDRSVHHEPLDVRPALRRSVPR